MYRVYKFRLYPTRQQESDLLMLLGRLRFFYNAALQERRDGYKAGVKVNYRTQSAAIAQVKNDPECPEYAGIHTHLLKDVVTRIDRAFERFFRRAESGEKAGYPRFKGQGKFRSFTFPDAANKNGAKIVSGATRVRLHGIGNVKMKAHRPMEGKLKTIGVTRDKCGDWYAIITREVSPQFLRGPGRSVGIDLGLTTFASFSDGTQIENPRPQKSHRVLLERAARKVSRCKRRSNGRRKARVLLTKLHRHIASVRRDFHHKTARAIVQKYDHVFIEDVDVMALCKGMLGKEFRDAGWGQFVAFLSAKAEETGRSLIRVDPNGTSQECSGCGERVPKALSVRVHDCPHCGLRVDRDVNAARNILNRGFADSGPGWGLRGGALQQQTPTIREAAA